MLLQDVGRHALVLDQAHVVVGLVAGITTAVCVLFHFEVMSWASRLLPRYRRSRRGRIVILMLLMLVAHVVEIWLFGLTYSLLDRFPELGTLEGSLEEGIYDFVYYSAACYTTLGFGDIVATGALRILTGTEALTGLGLITWTASLLFLEMQSDWAEFRRQPLVDSGEGDGGDAD